jgi:hypothetical protein
MLRFVSPDGFMRPDDALNLMKLGREHRQGKRSLPPKIVAKKKEIADATKNAELFMATLRQIDYGMIDHVVGLKRELDGLYAAWGAGSL